MIRYPNTLNALNRRAARMMPAAVATVLGPTLLVWGALLIFAPDVSQGATPAAKRPAGWSLESSPIPADATAWSDTVPASNTIIDLIYRAPDLWSATARGVSHVALPGDDWTSYGTDDGLGGPEIPALGVFQSGVWASTSHLQKLDNSSVARGDGIYLFDEGSGQWLDRSPTYELASGGTVRQASGAAMLCYDMAEFRDGLVAACWAGGLVLSPDAGETWKNVFLDGFARGDFEELLFNDLGNLYFSVVVDESAPESLSVYAGSAWGINKFIYLHDSLKITGYDFRDLALDGGRVYAATESGLSVTPNKGGSWRTFYESRGLPGDHIGTVAANGDTIWVGLESADRSAGEGVAYSIDDGASWIVPEPAALGSNRVRNIVVAGDGIWLASSSAGLLHYADDLWTSYLEDREVIGLLAVERDGLSPLIYAGTDIGIVTLTSESGEPWDTLAIGLPGDHISQRVIDLAFQPLPCDTINVGAEALWAIVRDADDDADSMNGFAVSTDGGTTWTVSSRRLPSSDVGFFGCRFYLASDSGLAQGNYPDINAVTFTSSFTSAISDGRISPNVQAVRTVIGKDYSGLDSLAEVWVGTEHGLARSLNAAQSWGVAFSNPNPNEFDLFRNFGNQGKDTLGSFIGLSGNFVTALALQPNPANPVSGKPVLWAATRGTGRGRYENQTSSYPSKNGISFSRDGGATWTVPDLDSLGSAFDIWNFSFDNSGQIWAASSQGLLGSIDGVNWTLSRSFEDPWSGATIDTTVEILDAETIGDELWVGTENGLFIFADAGSRVSGSGAEETHTGTIRRTFRPVDPDDVGSGGGAYATPVPYSPTHARSRGGLRLHFVPPVSGNVTITVYDFANNVVAVLTRGEYREEGVQYDESVVWDGRNGDGDVVAVGTYFFVIEYENGDVHWGKIAIIP